MAFTKHNIKKDRLFPLFYQPTYMKKTLSVVVFATLIASCEEEKIIEVEREYSWQADDNFIYNDIAQMNSFATDDMLFFRGYTSFTSMVADSLDHPDGTRGSNIVHFAQWFTQPVNEKLPIGPDFFVSAVPNGFMAFISNRSPVTESVSIYLDMKNIDNGFSNFYQIHFSRGEKIVINDRNQVLVPYQAFEPNETYVNSSPKLALINAIYDSISIEFTHRIDTISTQLISINDEYQNFVIALESIGANFFVTTDGKVYRIDSDGRMTTVLNERLYRIFEDAGRLLGFGDGHIYSSVDDGLTWAKGGESPWEITGMNFTTIGGKVVAYRFAQLWEVSTTETSFDFKELDNDGLDGKTITSVSEFDSKVFVTSLAGVYHRPSEEFFTYKEEE